MYACSLHNVGINTFLQHIFPTKTFNFSDIDLKQMGQKSCTITAEYPLRPDEIVLKRITWFLKLYKVLQKEPQNNESSRSLERQKAYFKIGRCQLEHFVSSGRSDPLRGVQARWALGFVTLLFTFPRSLHSLWNGRPFHRQGMKDHFKVDSTIILNYLSVPLNTAATNIPVSPGTFLNSMAAM